MTETSGPAPTSRPYSAPAGQSSRPQPANLADILERVLDKGIIIAGDIRVNLLDIELLTIKIRLLIVSVDKAQEMGIDWWRNDPCSPPASRASPTRTGGCASASRSSSPVRRQARAEGPSSARREVSRVAELGSLHVRHHPRHRSRGPRRDAPGSRGGASKWWSTAGLIAVVSDVDLVEFGEEGLRANLERLEWLEEVARGHDAVVQAVAALGPTAPLRLATICLDDGGVRRRLDEWYHALELVLDRVQGRMEWSVKAFAPHSRRGADSPGRCRVAQRRRRGVPAAQEDRAGRA